MNILRSRITTTFDITLIDFINIIIITCTYSTVYNYVYNLQCI